LSVALALYALATVDAAFCGYRAAAGRSALIAKRHYYQRAMLRGALWGQVAVAAAAGALLAFVLSSSEPTEAWHKLYAAGRRMLIVYLPYAGLILVAFAARAVPSVDVRSLTSTLVFGPMTLLRPFVAVAGMGWAIASSQDPLLGAIGIGVLALMLSMETLLGLRYRGSAWDPEPEAASDRCAAGAPGSGLPRER
jgi:hypothetical protein